MKKYSPRPDPLRFKNFGFNQLLANNEQLDHKVFFQLSIMRATDDFIATRMQTAFLNVPRHVDGKSTSLLLVLSTLINGRFFHQDGKYVNCPGGKDAHYDMSLWLTDDFKGGAGGDWGQRLATEEFLAAVKSGRDSIHIFLHEMVGVLLLLRFMVN